MPRAKFQTDIWDSEIIFDIENLQELRVLRNV